MHFRNMHVRRVLRGQLQGTRFRVVIKRSLLLLIFLLSLPTKIITKVQYFGSFPSILSYKRFSVRCKFRKSCSKNCVAMATRTFSHALMSTHMLWLKNVTKFRYHLISQEIYFALLPKNTLR